MNPSGLRRVLVVDPDPTIRELLLAVLKRRGLECDSAGDVEHAVQHAKSCPYAAVVVDPRMPLGDALLSRLYAAAEGRRNIIVATTPDSWAGTLATKPGVRAVLIKPFDLNELCARVRECTVSDGRGGPVSAGPKARRG